MRFLIERVKFLVLLITLGHVAVVELSSCECLAEDNREAGAATSAGGQGSETKVAAEKLAEAQRRVDRASKLANQKYYRSAIREYLGAIEMAPESIAAHNNLAWLLAMCPADTVRDGKEAVKHATKACSIGQWKAFATIDTLSVALAEAGQFDDALQVLSEFRPSATAAEQEKVDKRVALFRRGKTLLQELREAAEPATPEDGTRSADAALMAIYEKAVALEKGGHLPEAAVEFEKAVSVARTSLSPDALDMAILISRLGDVYFQLGKYDKAAACLAPAAEVLCKHYPRDNAEVTYVINNLASAKLMMRECEEAIRLNLENLRVREASLGKNHPHTLLSLHNLAMAYGATEHTKEAIEAFESWFARDERATSEKWPLLPVTLGNLGTCYTKVREFEKAEKYLFRSLAVLDSRPKLDVGQKINVLRYLTQLNSLKGAAGLEQARKHGELAVKLCRDHYGNDHLESARAIMLLGIAYHNSDKPAEAATLLRESIRIVRRAGLPWHEAATAASYLVQCDVRLGDLAEAEELSSPLMDDLEASLLKGTEELPQTAPAVYAEACRRAGHWERFERRMEAFVGSVESRAGKDSPALGRALQLVATAYVRTDRWKTARDFAVRALVIERKTLPADSLAIADTLECLGLVNVRLASYAEAESNYLESLSIRRKRLSENDPSIPRCLAPLGFAYIRMGRYDQAEKTLTEAVAIAEKAGLEGASHLAAATGYLGRLYTEQHRNAEAETCLKRNLEMTAQHEGKSSTNYAWSLIYLGQFYISAGRYSEAETTYREAIRVFHPFQTNGESEPLAATGGLGQALVALGKYDEAEEIIRKSVDRFEATTGGNERDHALTLQDLITIYVKTKRWDDAVPFCSRALKAGRRWLPNVLPALTPQEQLTYLTENEKMPLAIALSIAVRCTEKQRTAEVAAEWVINLKATGAEYLAEQMQLSRQSTDPTVQDALRELTDVREQLARVVLSTPMESQNVKVEQSGLVQRERDLARKLGLQTRQAARESAWVTLDEVRKALPSKSVLIEIVRFPLVEFGTSFNRAEPQFVAWVIPPAGKGSVRMIELGAASTIDAAIAKSRIELLSFPFSPEGSEARQTGETGESANKQLTKLLYKPLMAAIGDASNLIMSLDGSLWLFPLQALPMDDGSFLVEHKQIEYRITGRSLLDDPPHDRGTGAVVIGDPNYELEPTDGKTTAIHPWLSFLRRSAGSTIEQGLLAGGRFVQIQGEREWINDCVPLLRTYVNQAPKVLRDDEAVEGAFKLLKHPRVLVISTHGYFLSDLRVDNLPQTQEGQRALAAHNLAVSLGLTGDQIPLMPEPLLRCGLALAGANHHFQFPNANDGILTGLEILGADLHGTELVVLNACETGVGAVRDGEGTAGLHQAFQLAGCKVVVASLWQIPAKPFNRLLALFFRNLADKHNMASSFRKAQLALIDEFRKEHGTAPPALWAAFTMTGDCR